MPFLNYYIINTEYKFKFYIFDNYIYEMNYEE